MFTSTVDKILFAIVQHDGESAADILAAIRLATPSVNESEIMSAIADLSRQKEISVVYADGRIFAIRPQPYALSHLKTRQEAKLFQTKWDIIKIVFGYVLGFVSAWLLQ